MARSSYALGALAALLVVASASAHLCMLTPLQDGGAAGDDKPADNACALTTGPCGGVAPGTPSVTLKAGSTFQFQLMKNLDHFNPKSPGNFTVTLNPGAHVSTLGSTADTSAPSLTKYTVTGTIPSSAPMGTQTIQSIYYTSNPAAPSAFYQCATVTIA